MDITDGFFVPSALLNAVLQFAGIMFGIGLGIVVVIKVILALSTNATALALQYCGVGIAKTIQATVMTVFGLAPAIGVYIWMTSSAMDTSIVILIVTFVLGAGGVLGVIINTATNEVFKGDQPAPAES